MIVATVVILALAAATWFFARSARHHERRKLERLARRYGIDPSGLTDEQIESKINRLFFGWRNR